jgi:uncharacterized protein (TIGR04255 family)
MNYEKKVGKYKNAPISEVVCGITFNTNTLTSQNLIFDLIANYKKEYKNIVIQGPIADEQLNNYRLNQNFDINATGPGVFKLYTEDQHYLLQLQYNKIYFNWIRRDDSNVGSYPGFSVIYNKFQSIIKDLSDKLSSLSPNFNLSSIIKYCELGYQDRLSWQDHIESLSEIEKILKIKIPRIPATRNKLFSPNNIFAKYTIPLEEPENYAVLSINTTTAREEKQILIFDCNIKGRYSDSTDIEKWFKDMHNIQVSVFEDLFDHEILEKWT